MRVFRPDAQRQFCFSFISIAQDGISITPLIVFQGSFFSHFHSQLTILKASFIVQVPHQLAEKSFLPPIDDCMPLPEWLAMACHDSLTAGSLPDSLDAGYRFCNLNQNIYSVLIYKFFNSLGAVSLHCLRR